MWSLVWGTTLTFQFLVVVGVVDVSDALVSGRSLSVVGDRAPQRIMKQNIRIKSPKRSFMNTLSTLSVMDVYGGLLGSGLVAMRVGGWLRQTDPRLAPHFGGRRGFYVKKNSDPEVVGNLPQLQFSDKVVDIPVVVQRQIPMVLSVRKSIETPQLQYVAWWSMSLVSSPSFVGAKMHVKVSLDRALDGLRSRGVWRSLR